jgi:hypothetical protein
LGEKRPGTLGWVLFSELALLPTRWKGAMVMPCRPCWAVLAAMVFPAQAGAAAGTVAWFGYRMPQTTGHGPRAAPRGGQRRQRTG